MKRLLILTIFSMWGICSYAQDTTKTPNINAMSVDMWQRFQADVDKIGLERNYWYNAYHNLRDSLNTSVQPKVVKGFNIHTFTSSSYSNIDNTIAKVLAAGGNAVRVNINVTSAGVATNEPKLLELLTKCKSAGIIVMPMINIDNGDINGTTAAAATTAIGVAKYDFDYIEFGNEMAIKDWVGDGSVRALKTGDGDIASQYDTALLTKIGNTVKAMVDAYRIKKPNVKIILDGEWLHTYYMDYLLNNVGIKIDILAWHWYSGQQLARVGKTQIRDILKSRYANLPLLWNEIGVDTDNSTGTITQSHYTAFSDMHSVFKQDGEVFYELNDEPDRLPSKKEAGYGFFDANGNAKPVLNLIK